MTDSGGTRPPPPDVWCSVFRAIRDWHLKVPRLLCVCRSGRPYENFSVIRRRGPRPCGLRRRGELVEPSLALCHPSGVRSPLGAWPDAPVLPRRAKDRPIHPICDPREWEPLPGPWIPEPPGVSRPLGLGAGSGPALRFHDSPWNPLHVRRLALRVGDGALRAPGASACRWIRGAMRIQQGTMCPAFPDGFDPGISPMLEGILLDVLAERRARLLERLT